MIPEFQISVLFLKIIVIISSVRGEKSLFDEVPLNGALIPSDLDPTDSLSSETFTTKLPPDPTDPTSRTSRKHHHQKQQEYEVSSGGGSLFDDLPNYGAFHDQKPQSSSRNSNKIRTPRDSVDFEVTRINPSNDFDLPYWDKQFLAPIVNSIAARPPPPQHDNGNSRFPFLNFINNRGPPFPKSPKNLYGPPPPRRHNNQYGNYHPPSHHQEWNQHHHQNQPVIPLPVKVEDEGSPGQNQNKSLHVSANSGGPTVIVYTHTKKDAHSSQKESSHWTSTEAPTKNEIHYHYHMKNEQDSRPKPPPYGRRPLFPPRGRFPPPPKHSYGQPAPPPPQKGSGYPPSATPQSNTHRIESKKESHSTLSFNEENDHDGDDFSQRTFITKSRTPPSSYNPAADLSTSYEIPPAFNAPSSTYAVPPPSSKYGVSHKEPESSYGPPSTSPPAPPPPQSDVGGDQYETTITLQTIPVTRQVTELVQVPNVVHKISSNRPHQAEQQQAQLDDYGQQQQQLSTAYGPPAPPPSRTATPITNPSQRNERPFETHLSQILGVPSTNPQTSNNNNNAILQELLLSQSRSPGYDLTLSDLELLSLLQASKGGGGGGSNIGILQPQSSRSNLFGGLFGTRSQFPVSSLGFQNSAQGGWSGSSNNDGLSSFREAFREQRLQIALQDLRKQLRDQNRDNQRERSGVRSLFTKGAMLLSALTLLPTMMNPVAAAAGFGSAASGSAAAAASATFPNFMLPVSAAAGGLGRRKRRSLQTNQNIGVSGILNNNDVFTRSDNATVAKLYQTWTKSELSKDKMFRNNNIIQKSPKIVQLKFFNILRDPRPYFE